MVSLIFKNFVQYKEERTLSAGEEFRKPSICIKEELTYLKPPINPYKISRIFISCMTIFRFVGAGSGPSYAIGISKGQ